MWHHTCPRCHGDLLRQPDLDGDTVIACLQCGRTVPEQELDEVLRERRARAELKRPAA